MSEIIEKFGTNYKNFGQTSKGVEVFYPLASQSFPIGYIADKNTPANLARQVFEEKIGSDFGPIIHLALAPHPRHNMVHMYRPENKCNVCLCGDAVIVERGFEPFMIETMLGDCALIVVTSEQWVGFAHVGRPELMETPSIIEEFFRLWRGETGSTNVWIGPCITGKYYELPQIPAELSKFVCQTVWGTQGFDLHQAIVQKIDEYLSKFSIICESITDIQVDPFEVNENGDHSWAASDQWYKRQGKELGFPIFSPRNAAMVVAER